MSQEDDGFSETTSVLCDAQVLKGFIITPSLQYSITTWVIQIVVNQIPSGPPDLYNSKPTGANGGLAAKENDCL